VRRDIKGNEFCLGAAQMPSAPPADRQRILALAARLADTASP
jgi:hypothetical protein